MSFDPKKHIKISNLDEAKEIRSKLIKFIWKGEHIPSVQPTKTKPSNAGHAWEALCLKKMNSLRKADQFKLRMEHGINSISYLYTPKNNNKKTLIIYHHGHGPTGNEAEPNIGQHAINFFLSKGYHVMGLSMPLSWPNNKASICGVNYGSDVDGHNAFKKLETKKFCPMKFFIEPVCASLNILEKEYDFDSYNMVGLSGGGVTTMICSAIDERISHGYNVAGGIPIKLRTSGRDKGDYEQVHPKFYSIANYLDLYILGSLGEGRKCVQIYNRHDSCCFAGNPHTKWESAVKKSVNKMNGYYNVYSDSSHRAHIISNWALEKILKEMES